MKLLTVLAVTFSLAGSLATASPLSANTDFSNEIEDVLSQEVESELELTERLVQRQQREKLAVKRKQVVQTARQIKLGERLKKSQGHYGRLSQELKSHKKMAAQLQRDNHKLSQETRELESRILQMQSEIKRLVKERKQGRQALKKKQQKKQKLKKVLKRQNVLLKKLKS